MFLVQTFSRKASPKANPWKIWQSGGSPELRRGCLAGSVILTADTERANHLHLCRSLLLSQSQESKVHHDDKIIGV